MACVLSPSFPHPPQVFDKIPNLPTSVRVLPQLCSLLSHKWVRDYLLDQSAIQLPILTSLASQNHGLTVTFLEEYSAHSPSIAREEMARILGVAFLAPAFAVDGIQAGLAIKKRSQAIPARGFLPWMAIFNVDHVRFVSDTNTSFMICVRSNRRSPLVFLETFCFDNPHQRCRTQFTMHADMLHALFRNECLQPQRLESALLMMQVITEWRECNVCLGALPQCKCNSSVHERHPLDFEAIKRNMLSHFGAFTGVQTYVASVPGYEVATGELGTKFTISYGAFDERDSLLGWAIEDLVQCEVPVVKNTPKLMQAAQYGYFGDLDEVDEEFLRGGTSESKTASESGKTKASSESKCSTDGNKRTSESKTNCESTGSSGAEVGVKRTIKKVEKVPVSKISAARLAKVQERREKNRECARASNLKKKLYNQTLRSNLKQSKEYCERLEEREAALRTENSELRTKVRALMG